MSIYNWCPLYSSYCQHSSMIRFCFSLTLYISALLKFNVIYALNIVTRNNILCKYWPEL